MYCLEKDQWLYHGVGEEEQEQRRLCMAVQLFSKGSHVYCLAGYEDGSVCLWQMDQKLLLWDAKEHTEPSKSMNEQSGYGLNPSNSPCACCGYGSSIWHLNFGRQRTSQVHTVW